MDALRTWLLLTVLAVVAVLAGGWFLLVSPQRGEAQDLRAQAAQADRATTTLRSQLQVLEAQARDLPQEQAGLAAVSARLPDDPAQPALLRALAAAADATGVELVSVTPGALAPVTPSAAAAATPVAPPAAAAAPTAALVPTTGAPSAGGVGALSAMPLTITAAGGYYELQQYLAALEELPRALRVSGLTITPGASPARPPSATASVEDGRHLLATITGAVYVATGATPVTPVVAPPATQ